MQLLCSAGFIFLIVLWGILAPDNMASVFSAMLAALTRNFGWFYLWVVLALVLFAAFVAFSRYGNLKLGGEDDEPEFTVGSWFSMLFAAGMGIGLVFWGVAEPVSHYVTAPPGITPGTPEAANAAMRYVFFHWGIHPWAVYSVVALAIAFFQYRRGGNSLISTVTSSLPWRPIRAMSGLFNGLAIVATAFGVAASLGVGALQINSGLNAVFGVAISPTAQVVIIIVTAAMFLTSAISGVEKGIKFLSNANMAVAALLAVAVFLLGPTVGNWTIFYWAWWISWSPFVGLFIARVSRGRTIREFILGTVLAPSLAAFIWFSIFGGTALYLEIWQHVPLAEAVKADLATALFALFDAMPFGQIMSVVATLLVVVFFVTSGDSAVLVLGMMSQDGNPNPTTRVKLVWGTLIAGIAISLLLAGGIDAVQTATILFALPFALVIVLMVIALWRGLRDDWEEEARRERALRRKMREMAAR
jgi:glycine betaine transporter